jgi:hypothetical protein
MRLSIAIGFALVVACSATAQVRIEPAPQGGLPGGPAGGVPTFGDSHSGSGYQGSATDLKGSGYGNITSAPTPTNPDGTPIEASPPEQAAVSTETTEATETTPDVNLQVIPPEAPPDSESEDGDSDSQASGLRLEWWQIFLIVLAVGFLLTRTSKANRR